MDFIQFFKIDSQGNFKPKYRLNITKNVLEEYHLSGPNGLSFSKDGYLLATIHQRCMESDDGLSAVAIFKRQISHKKNDTYQLHSILYYGEEKLNDVSFHPSGNYLAVSIEMNHVMILERVPGSNSFHETLRLIIDQCESCKGVAFSPQGDLLVVTTSDPNLLLFHVETSEVSH